MARDLSLGTQIRSSRNARRITQEQLALLIGTSQDRVSRWERGLCRPEVEYLAKIAVHLKVSIRLRLHGSLILIEVERLSAVPDRLDG